MRKFSNIAKKSQTNETPSLDINTYNDELNSFLDQLQATLDNIKTNVDQSQIQGNDEQNTMKRNALSNIATFSGKINRLKDLINNTIQTHNQANELIASSYNFFKKKYAQLEVVDSSAVTLEKMQGELANIIIPSMRLLIPNLHGEIVRQMPTYIQEINQGIKAMNNFMEVSQKQVSQGIKSAQKTKKNKKAQNTQSSENDQAALNSNQVEDPVRSLADMIEEINTKISKKNSIGNVFQGDERAGIKGLDRLSGENNSIYGINIYDNAVHSAIENFGQELIDKEEFVDQLQSQYGTNDQVLKIQGELEETGEKQMQSSQKIKKMVLASTAHIKELAERDVENSSKTFSLEKTAQHQTVDELVLHGPGSKRISPFTGQLESDWHVIERNKGWGFRVGDLWNIDFETMWRRHIMDKYYRPYKDDKGNWTGGYLQKRFEIDRWQPEENKMQLLPGQKRRPIIQEQRSTESRLEASRDKKLQTQDDKKFEDIKLAKTAGFCVENYVGHKKKKLAAHPNEKPESRFTSSKSDEVPGNTFNMKCQGPHGEFIQAKKNTVDGSYQYSCPEGYSGPLDPSQAGEVTFEINQNTFNFYEYQRNKRKQENPEKMVSLKAASKDKKDKKKKDEGPLDAIKEDETYESNVDEESLVSDQSGIDYKDKTNLYMDMPDPDIKIEISKKHKAKKHKAKNHDHSCHRTANMTEHDVGDIAHTWSLLSGI